MSSNRHHKCPRSRGGDSSRRNLSRINSNRHYLWHQLFQNMTGDEIMQDFNCNFIDQRFKIVRR